MDIYFPPSEIDRRESTNYGSHSFNINGKISEPLSRCEPQTHFRFHLCWKWHNEKVRWADRLMLKTGTSDGKFLNYLSEILIRLSANWQKPVFEQIFECSYETDIKVSTFAKLCVDCEIFKTRSQLHSIDNLRFCNACDPLRFLVIQRQNDHSQPPLRPSMWFFPPNFQSWSYKLFKPNLFPCWLDLQSQCFGRISALSWWRCKPTKSL